VLVSLRRELYDKHTCTIRSAQKIRDIIETVQWDEPQLLELIAKRLLKQRPEFKEGSHEDKWTLYSLKPLSIVKPSRLIILWIERYIGLAK